MEISTRKIMILYRKDILDILKNISISISCIMPLFFAILYRYMFTDLPLPEGYLLTLILALNLTMTAVIIPATSIAEEKEKHTLRTLMLSNISGLEFCMSKMLTTSSLLLITNILIFFILDVSPVHIPALILATLVGSLPMILLGAVIGLAARDQMTAGVYEVPLMLIFLLPSIFAAISSTAEFIARITPCNALIQVVLKITEEQFVSKDTFLSIAVILIWILIASTIFILLFKKKGTDN